MSSGKEDEVSTHPRRWGFAAQHLTEQAYGLVVWSWNLSEARETEIKNRMEKHMDAMTEKRQIYQAGDSWVLFDKVRATRE